MGDCMIVAKLASATVLAASASALAQAPAPTTPTTPTTPAERAAIADAIAPALVRVALHLQYDEGEAPNGSAEAWRPRRSPLEYGNLWADYEDIIRQERPAERGGFLLGPRLVVTTDPLIDDRFIRRITVQRGDAIVEARPSAYATSEDAIFLELAQPLPGPPPPAFDPAAERPHHAIIWGPFDAAWRTIVEPVSGEVWVLSDGRRVTPAAPGSLIVDRHGTPVGLSSFGYLALDGSWKGTPESWPAETAAAQASLEQRIASIADDCLPRVELRFRSPRGSMDAGPSWEYGDTTDESETEWNGLGVVVEDRLVLVLASLKPRKTARLEQIQVHLADGRAVDAHFAGTLSDHGCFLARLDEPLPGPAVFLEAPIESVRERLLVQAEIRVHGETRSAHYGRQRIAGFQIGWVGKVYPAVSPVSGGSGSSMSYAQNFLFDPGGRLVALPVERRQKVSVEQEWDDEPLMTPAAHLSQILRDPGPHLDPENRPLSEDQENRIAWLGVELQPLDPELARAKKVSALSGGGATGAIVTYLYAGSPAAAGGMQPGDILLRLNIEGHPKPLEVDLSGTWSGMSEGFPWDRLGDVPEEYFDQIPTPWESVENALALALTEVGFGTPFTAEVFRDGTVIRVSLRVAEGPPHSEAAPRFESEGLGLTVRDLTYEVRRYFQMKVSDPGVIISKVEPGGAAAIAGLRPYEIINRVDNQPVADIEAFGAAVAPAGEHRLVVKRMTEGRIVTIRSSADDPAPEDDAPDDPADR